MRNLLFLLLLAGISTMNVFATKHTITNVGTTFSPAEITIAVGDTIVFVLASAHNAVEVSKATYDANGTTSNGGFSVPNGGGSVAFPTAGIYYFVCQPHASLGMKGIITVSTSTAVKPSINDPVAFSIYPNPVHSELNVSYWVSAEGLVRLSLLDQTGRKVSDVSSRNAVAGFHNETYTFPRNLTPGVYFITLSVGSDQITKKVLIVPDR